MLNRLKNFYLTHKEAVLVALLILVYSLAIWWPTRNLPYYWDGAMTINKASRVIIERNFSPLIVEFTDFAHPPLFNLLHIAALKIFGDTLLAAHLLLLPFLPAYLGLTYVLAKRALNDVALAFAATALVATTPFVLAEYGNIYLDLTMAVFVLAALLAQVYKRWRLAITLLTLATLTKLTALVSLPMLAYLALKQQGEKKNWRPLLWYVFPVIIATAWVLYHHSYTNWWLVIPGRNSYIPTDISELIASLEQVGFALLIDQFRWVMSLVFVISLIKGRHLWKKDILLTAFILGILLVMGQYVVMGELQYRYLLFVYPLVIIVGLTFTRSVIKKPAHLLIGVGVVCLFFYSAWHPRMTNLTEYLIRPYDDLRYLDIISLGTQTTQYLVDEHPTGVVYGGHPESYQLPESFQGYTQKPVAFNYCHYYQPQPNREVLIMHHKYSPLQPVCEQLLSQVPHELVKTFEQNGFWVNIYRVVN